MKDEYSYEDAAWVDDMARFTLAVVLIVSVISVTGLWFWLWGWI